MSAETKAKEHRRRPSSLLFRGSARCWGAEERTEPGVEE